MSWVQNNSHNHAPPPIPQLQQQQQQQSSPPPAAAAAYFGKSQQNNNNNAISALNPTTGLHSSEDNYVNNATTMSQYNSNHNNNNGMGLGVRGAQQMQQQSLDHHQSSYAKNAPNHLNNQQHISQQQNWQQQQQMPPMQPPVNNVVVPQTANNNWQTQNPQQQQQQQHNQNLANANVYQQQQQHQGLPPGPPTAANNWQKTAAAPPATTQQQQSSYANYYAQQNATDPMLQKPQRNYAQHESVNFFQQTTMPAPLANQQQQQLHHPPQQQMQQQSQLVPQPQPPPPSVGPASNDYFDNSVRSNNNNNNTNTSLTNSQTDGWSDWDWNDNSGNVVNNEVDQQQMPLPPQPEVQQQQNVASPPQQPQQHVYNSIEDSFSNDNWNWNVSEEQTLQNTPSNQSQQLHKSSANVMSTPSSVQQIPLVSVPHLVAHSKPTTLPLPESVNDNYNELKGDIVATTVDTAPSIVSATSVTTSHNIPPSSVYVSQAKPVARPARQYASPPGGNTPTGGELPHSALTPPHAFQNETEATSGIVQTPANPMVAQLPPAAVPPPTGALGNTAAAGGNPFKRAGAAQHHRAFGLLPTTAAAAATSPQLGPPSTAGVAPAAVAPTSFNAPPPPPPADFANPLPPPIPTNDLESAENAEDLHENQEVLAPPPPLPSVGMQQVSLMGGSSTIASPPPPPPPNDERNQYMQTSQLSENPDEELNIEADSLPPPGLSRLVLGQPEFAAASQRQVTGTEEPPNALALSMPIEERQADGEDTSDELAAIQAPVAQMPSTDRNLYLVPGESVSSVNVQQRVVTGVEMGSADVSNVNLSTPPSNEQREIVLDGENLNDPHQPQPHQPQQQQAVSRNEPPLEGAASGSDAPAPASATTQPTESQNVSTPQQNPTKSTNDHHSNQMSTGNDDESDAAEQRYAAYNKKSSHKPAELSKSERQRKEKQRSVDRYESEDSLEYSSERELERERDRDGRDRRGGVRTERDDVREYHRSSKKQSKRVEKAPIDSDERKQRDKYYRGAADPARSERRSQRYQPRYDADSRYETEESISRHETSRKDGMRRSMRGGASAAGNSVQPADERSGGRSDRSDRDYDDYRQRYQRSGGKRDKDADRSRRAPDDDRRDPRRTRQRNERDDYDATLERQRRRHYRGGPDPRVDPREYDEYRKKSSRNARDSDLEQERLRDPRDIRDRYDPRQAAAMYAYPSAGYAYDPYTTYYYEQMARTNPQAYAELYKKYYGHAPPAGALGAAAGSAAGTGFVSAAGLPAVHQEHQSLNASTAGNTTGAGAAADGRESVHSGRSSAHNDKDRSGHLSLRDVADPSANEPQRLTPAKFNSDHAIVSFSSGILVTFKPRYTSHGHINNIVKLLRLNINDATRQVMQSFPGPLVRGLTHKKTIIEFCEEQIRLGPMHTTTTSSKQLLSTNVDKYRASYTLMWNLLILLLRQNGMVVGTDIAELLLKNQQQYPYQPNANQTPNLSATSTSRSTKSDSPENDASGNDNSDIEDESNELLQNDDESIVQKDSVSSELSAKLESESKSVPQQEQQKQLTETEITEKFRNYLLYGNVNEALDWATDNNLWGHALFLASKVDRRLHANVMMKFANKLALNDPLQTLYQLMSGRTPSSVTSIQDEKWGDWRPHLSMILSNTSQKPELDRKAITTLGDSLFNRGDLFAAHFCYLMAQVGFGRYQENVAGETSIQQNLPKLVLLGSSHYKPFHEFATTEAIIMTEIYEYACSLNDEKFSIVEFQPYKYLLAARLIDYGYHLKSLMYLEQTALHVQRDPVKYEASLIGKIYELADRLKYYDPVLDKADDESSQNLDGSLNASGATHLEEQKWLQDLRLLAAQHKFDYQPVTSAALPNAESYSQTVSDSYQVQNQIDQQFMEINKQFNELNLQYANDANVVAAAVPTFYNPDTIQSQQQPEQTAQQQDNSLSQQSPPLPLYDQQQQQMQHTNYSPDAAAAAAAQQNLTQESQENAQATSGNVDPYANYQQQYMQPLDQQQYQQNSYYDPTQQQQQQQYGTEGTEQTNIGNQQQSYDYWAQQQQQGQYGGADENAARPTISMPKSKTFDSDDEKQQARQRQNNNATQQQQGKKAQQEQQQQRGKNDAKDPNKNAAQANQNSGWFGGIWNKLSLKPKNQMILPDDKNPAIVWDPEKKRWINTDGGEDNNEESLKPPPKMSDIMPQGAQQQAAPPQFPGQPQQQQQQQQAQHQYQHQQQQQQPMQQDPNLMPAQQQYAGMPATSPAAVPLHNANTAATPSNVPTGTGPSSNYSASAANAGTISDSNAPTKPPSLQSNMFKMQRNRTLKNSYVDVFNPSGKPASKEIENVLAPSLPPANVPQGGFFIPGAAQNDSSGGYQQQQQQPQQQDTPQFYNPNQFAGGSGY